MFSSRHDGFNMQSKIVQRRAEHTGKSNESKEQNLVIGTKMNRAKVKAFQ